MVSFCHGMYRKFNKVMIRRNSVKKPELKKSPKGHGCQCGAYNYDECGCDISWADNDGYNKAIEEYDKYHEAILCEKDNEIEELKKQINSTIGMNDRDIYWKDFYKKVIQELRIARQAETAEIMSKATELISTKLDNKNTDYIELKGCYDMDTAILHKEIFELREEIKSLKLGLEDEELFNNIDKA